MLRLLAPVTAPMVSEEAALALPVETKLTPRTVAGALSLTRLVRLVVALLFAPERLTVPTPVLVRSAVPPPEMGELIVLASWKRVGVLAGVNWALSVRPPVAAMIEAPTAGTRPKT